MHPDTYRFLADERIAGLHRDADRRRLARLAGTGGRATVHHPQSASLAGIPRTPAPVSGLRGG